MKISHGQRQVITLINLSVTANNFAASVEALKLPSVFIIAIPAVYTDCPVPV